MIIFVNYYYIIAIYKCDFNLHIIYIHKVYIFIVIILNILRQIPNIS